MEETATLVTTDQVVLDKINDDVVLHVFRLIGGIFRRLNVMHLCLLLSCHLHAGKIPGYLFNLPEIEILHLSSNQLSGHLEDIENPLS